MFYNQKTRNKLLKSLDLSYELRYYYGYKPLTFSVPLSKIDYYQNIVDEKRKKDEEEREKNKIKIQKEKEEQENRKQENIVVIQIQIQMMKINIKEIIILTKKNMREIRLII